VNRYAGQVVMVTGAGQGLGRAMAERFSQEGARLALGDINPDGVRATAAACDAGRAIPSVVDVTDPDQVRDWGEATRHAFGRVDVLVNNAGVIRDNRLERMTDEDWQRVVDVSLRGMFHCCRAVFGHMKQQRYGRILSLSSMSWHGNFGQVNYAAAKAGVIGAARTIALEGAAYGITSNVIAPGLIDTPMLASMKPSAREKLASRIPVRHTGRPEDIAEAAAYLCSRQATYVTGVVLDVDGGISIGSSTR
jgi:3-oxoacyl-[acyl-carrier protein] reductase